MTTTIQQVEASTTNKYIIIIFAVHLLLVAGSIYALVQAANYIVALRIPELVDIAKTSVQSIAADTKRAADAVENYTTLGSLGMQKQSNSANALISYTTEGKIVQEEQRELIKLQTAQATSKNAFAA